MENKIMWVAIDSDGGITKMGEDTMRGLNEYLSSARCPDVVQFLVDVDNTIRNHTSREKYLPSPEQVAEAGDTPNIAFTEYNDHCHEDVPIKGVVEMLRSINTGNNIALLSSCTASPHAIKTTYEQMKAWGVPFSMLFMRGEDNHLFPVDFKKDFLVKSSLSTWGEELVLIDDCPDNCTMYAELGHVSLNLVNNFGGK